MVSINTNSWMPDTCKCKVEYTYDRDSDKATRNHSLKNVIKKCPDHSDLSDGLLYSNLFVENRMKNVAIGHLVEHTGVSEDVIENGITMVNGDGNPQRKLKTGVNFSWSFEGRGVNRPIKIKVSGYTMTTSELAQEKGFLESQFATNRVTFE